MAQTQTTVYPDGAIAVQETEPREIQRKLVQLQKQGGDAFVNCIGDETLGLVEADNDSILCFTIENHPQRDEIVSYMRYDKETDTFYMPEPRQQEEA
jgi:hypothetical protein